MGPREPQIFHRRPALSAVLEPAPTKGFAVTTWLDHAPSGVLVLCHACPSWREHARNRAHGWSVGLEHARRVHGSESAAARHAEKNRRKAQGEGKR